jgi:predicted amidohydrolase
MTEHLAAPCTSEGRSLRVAAVQLASGSDVSKNLDACARATEDAAKAGADLVVLPENFAYAGPEAGKRALAESLVGDTGTVGRSLASWARAHRLTLVAGGMPERSEDAQRPFNTCAVFSPAGELVARYRKRHLFDVELPEGTRYCESEATTAGSDIVSCSVGGAEVGLSICYDLRFPELYRRLVQGGAQLLLIPSAFTRTTGAAHWHVLVRARAIENQCFVVAPGQCGEALPGRPTFGHSLIVDPWGRVLAEAADEAAVLIQDLDFAELARVRAKLPALRHRRDS